MNRTVTLSILATLILGCATTKVGAPATSASVEAIQRENPGATVVVERLAPAVAVRPPPVRLTLVRTTPAATIVAAGVAGAQLSLPTSDVARLTVIRHGRGALYGAGVGVLLAAGLTGLAVLRVGACNACEGDFTRGDAARAVGLTIGVPVLLLSTAVGALVGARTTYVFE